MLETTKLRGNHQELNWQYKLKLYLHDKTFIVELAVKYCSARIALVVIV